MAISSGPVGEPSARCAPSAATPDREPTAARLLRGLRYGFVVLLGDIAPWLAGGFLLTGIVAALLPPDLSVFGLGGGIVAMLAALAVSVPVYLCASASTPVAAALVAKGLSPGAALVLLLAGPATNAASLTVLAAELGRRTVRIYLSAIVVGSLAAGLALDALLAWTGWRVLGGLDHAAHAMESSPWALAAGVALAGSIAFGVARRIVRRTPEGAAPVAAGRGSRPA